MKITKLLSAAAAVVVAGSALAATASADLVVPANHDAGLSVGTGMWLIQLYNVGSEAENKPATDYGIDYSKVAKIAITLRAVDPDWMTGGLGGGMVYSVNGGDITNPSALWDKYNWPGNGYWGIDDPDLPDMVTQDTSQACLTEALGNFTYRIALDVVNPLANGDAAEIGCMQAGVQYWGDDMSDYEVIQFDVYDASGTVLLSFDGEGNLLSGGGSAPAPATEPEPAPAPAPSDDGGSSAPAPAPSKGNPDTGVEGVAAVAGLGLVAAGAVVLSRKKK